EGGVGLFAAAVNPDDAIFAAHLAANLDPAAWQTLPRFDIRHVGAHTVSGRLAGPPFIGAPSGQRGAGDQPAELPVPVSALRHARNPLFASLNAAAPRPSCARFAASHGTGHRGPGRAVAWPPAPPGSGWARLVFVAARSGLRRECPAGPAPGGRC